MTLGAMLFCAVVLGYVIATNIWYWSLPPHERELKDDDWLP
jgi:hypothetical protein